MKPISTSTSRFSDLKTRNLVRPKIEIAGERISAFANNCGKEPAS